MLTREQAQKLSEKILGFSKFPDCSVSISEGEDAFIRFANNGVTTSGFTNKREFVISSTRDQKTGMAQVNDLDDASLRALSTASRMRIAATEDYHEGPRAFIEKREPWRRVSVIADVCAGRVMGKGAAGYDEALDLLLEQICSA